MKSSTSTLRTVDWELERAFERVKAKQAHDPVNHPQHYTNHPSGIEAIQITEHMSFCLGNALKYIWRADLKGGVEDLRKAAWYIEREIKRRELAGAAKDGVKL